jgi:hypothetical protein
MSALTAVILDPAEVADSRTELNLNSGSLRVGPDGIDWGEAALQAFMAQASRGELPVDFRLPNRQIKIPLLLGADGKAGFAAARRNLQAKVALFQREGGWLKRGADILGVRVTDDFAANTIANYTADLGSGTLSVSGGQLVPSSTTDKRYYRNTGGYDSAGRYYDTQVTLKFTTGASVAGSGTGVTAKRLDANNWLLVQQTAAANLDIFKFDGGSFTNLATVASSISTATSYWVVIRVAGNVVTGELWTSAPSLTGSPSKTVSATLTGADATKFGQGVGGQPGLRVVPSGTDWRYDDFAVEPLGAVYADVVNAGLALPDKYSHLGMEADVLLSLEAIPDFYGDEIPLSDHVETTLPWLKFTESGILGDYPGRLRLVVDNDSSADWLGLVAAVRSRRYDSAATAALAYEAEALTPLDTAAATALTGASGAGSNTIRHNNLGTQWTPVLSTNLLAGTFLTHKGSYRVRARVYSTSATPPAVRFVWDVGDLVSPEENDPVAIPGASNFYLVDLGEIRLDPVGVGAHRWQGQVQAKGAAGGENVYVDTLEFEPLDEGHAILRAPISPAQGLVAPALRDEFNQTSGALNGKTLAVGGTWATSGSATDLAVDATTGTVTRSTNSDASPRYAIAGTATFTNALVQIDFERVALRAGFATRGVVARWTDANNYVGVEAAGFNSLSDDLTVVVRGAVGGVAFSLGSTVLAVPLDVFYSALLMVDSAGHYFAWVWAAGTARPAEPTLTGQDSRLATGGALANGKCGYLDYNPPPAAAAIRAYDNFLAYAPSLDAVAYASRSAHLGTDGNVRQDAAGAAYGPLSIDTGDLLRIPPSGLEGRAVEVFIKPSRGDLDQLPDSAIDDVSARAYYRPSYLTLPY